MIKNLSVAFGLMLVVGCSSAPEGVDDVLDDDAVQQLEQGIAYASPGGNSGAVEIGYEKKETGRVWTCTGTVIGRSMVLTSSKCFDLALGDDLTAYMRLSIAYPAQDGTSWRCINGTSDYEDDDGRCVADSWVRVIRNAAPADASEDFAAIFPLWAGRRWENAPPPKVSAIYTGDALFTPGMIFSQYGAGIDNPGGLGFTSGPMHYFFDFIDEVEEGTFTAPPLAGGARVCLGDEGGPYFAGSTGVMLGMHSRIEGAPCNEIGDQRTAFRFTETAMARINNWRILRGQPRCEIDTSICDGCWVCP
jgi:hypothetical protein